MANNINTVVRGLSKSPSLKRFGGSVGQDKPVVLVVGAGAGIGAHVSRRFAEGGYHACLCRRSDAEGLEKTLKDIEDAGGTASGFLLDASKPNTIETMVADVENKLGPIHVAVYNLGAQIGDRDLSQTTHKQFELGWKLGTLGLFRLSKSLLPLMADRGSGTLLVTSSTSAVRGNGGQHSHAAAMGGRRMLCQTLNAEFARRGVHVAHVIIDGAVDAPDTLGRMLGPEKFQMLRKAKGPHGLLDPAAVAMTYWHLAHQHPSAWTFELDLRSPKDVAWWNSKL